MKKFFLALAAAIVLSSVSAHAGVKFGVTGGLGFNTAEFTKMDVESRTGWNAGVTFGVELPMGFSFSRQWYIIRKVPTLPKEFLWIWVILKFPYLSSGDRTS